MKTSIQRNRSLEKLTNLLNIAQLTLAIIIITIIILVLFLRTYVLISRLALIITVTVQDGELHRLFKLAS